MALISIVSYGGFYFSAEQSIAHQLLDAETGLVNMYRCYFLAIMLYLYYAYRTFVCNLYYDNLQDFNAFLGYQGRESTVIRGSDMYNVLRFGMTCNVMFLSNEQRAFTHGLN